MNLMITGGAGFIGSHMARRMAPQAERIVLLDNFNNAYDPAIKWANVRALAASRNVVVVEADVRDAARVERLIVDHRITHILHLAAMANVRSSIEQAPLYTEVNVLGTVNVLEAARRHNVRQVVCASTSSVYGADSPVPFTEDAPALHPLASYPASKRAAEIIGYTFFHLFGLNITFLRLFNVYGPNGRPDMMPLRVLEAIVHGREITLFNGGQMRRDWTYIDDIVDGLCAALERPLGYRIINLGCGEPETMLAFVALLEELTGRRALTRDAPAPPSEPPITYCDNSRARELLDFAPKVSLREGLGRTWEWYRRVRGVR